MPLFLALAYNGRMKSRSKKEVKAERRAAAVAPRNPQPLAVWQLWAAAFSGVLLFIAAMPRFDLQPVGWVAPLPWLWLISRPELPAKRPYLVLWLAGFVLWAWVLQGISLAHPALIAGWLVLSAYLAIYTPLFVGLSRQMVYVWRVPLVFAAPLVWAGLELFRGQFATSFAAGLLGHTQTRFPIVIQIADLGGGYLVSFVMLTVAAGAVDGHFRWWEDRDRRASAWRVLYAAAVLFATLMYGHRALGDPNITIGYGEQPLRVVLIQGSLDTKFEMSHERLKEVMDHYYELTSAAIKQHPQMDLLVWPESSCPEYVLYTVAPGYVPGPELKMSPQEFTEGVEARNKGFERFLSDLSQAAHAPVMVNTATYAFTRPGKPPESYNSAIWTNAKGELAGQYHKMHPVMFGEYIPLFHYFPDLYSLTPMPGGLTPGQQPEVMFLQRVEQTAVEVDGQQTQQRQTSNYRLAPSICFESTVPHLIRRQVAQLRARHEEPDVLVNVTNDGWFWGSGILDLHLNCSIFRAVEMRKPMLIAANTGLSAHIDGNGLVRQVGPRRKAAILFTEVLRDGRKSVYSQYGDVFGWLCAGGTLGALGHATVAWRRRSRKLT